MADAVIPKVVGIGPTRVDDLHDTVELSGVSLRHHALLGAPVCEDTLQLDVLSSRERDHRAVWQIPCLNGYLVVVSSQPTS